MRNTPTSESETGLAEAPRGVESRSTAIQFRVTAAEKQAIHRRARAAGLRPSEFIRREALGRDAPGLAGAPLAPRQEPASSASAQVDEREVFIARRAGQLYAQGRTRRLARSEAEAEWRARGEG